MTHTLWLDILDLPVRLLVIALFFATLATLIALVRADKPTYDEPIPLGDLLDRGTTVDVPCGASPPSRQAGASTRSASPDGSEPVRASDPSFVLAEARKSLASLALPAETMRNVEAFLMKVCTAESTVPSITPGEDEGSALLHWVAGPMSVEVEVGPKGATYFWGLDQHGHQQSAEGSRLQIESMARALISVIASQVQQANPEWRRQYLQR